MYDLHVVLSFLDLTSSDMTGYTFDSKAGAWSQVKFTLPGHIFTLWFFRVSVLSQCDIYYYFRLDVCGLSSKGSQ